jgi:hypothetical protein
MSAVRPPRRPPRIQSLTDVQNGESRPLHVLRQSLAAEGPRFLLRGWTPAFVRLGPNTVLMFVFFEVRAASRALFLSARR